jgi:beta-glucanase (GH16 family)
MAQNAGQVVLAENASADGAEKRWPVGPGWFVAEATWGGGSATLQMKSPNGTWIPAATALTANGAVRIDLPAGPVRVAIVTATAVYAYLVGIPSN